MDTAPPPSDRAFPSLICTAVEPPSLSCNDDDLFLSICIGSYPCQSGTVAFHGDPGAESRDCGARGIKTEPSYSRVNGYEPIETDTNRSAPWIPRRHRRTGGFRFLNCTAVEPPILSCNDDDLFLSICIGSYPCQARIACFRFYPDASGWLPRPRIGTDRN